MLFGETIINQNRTTLDFTSGKKRILVFVPLHNHKAIYYQIKWQEREEVITEPSDIKGIEKKQTKKPNILLLRGKTYHIFRLL